ncbi:SemiSWEET family sugar transporter [Acinetobacter sp. HY1485]|uniref:SemiSWEET family sugar transporter n=1 Tax=Acinetobacter sp. HY1485 TaxID=2970918 RepID=UPI0022B94444|nr:SemiSWEET family transporter [Acinetobacter sp. HY1485]
MNKNYLKDIYIVIGTVIAVCISVAILYQYPVALGALAAWVTTGSFFLQVVHMIRKRDTTGVSLGMYAALFFGVTSWTFYGYQMHDIPVMTANGLTAVLAIVVIGLKLYNERPIKQKKVKAVRSISKKQFS